MVSFLENNLGNNEVFLISDEITDADIFELQELVATCYKSSLKLFSIRPDALNGFATSGHISPVAYARLLLPEVLPSQVDRVLYLDSDLVVVGNISESLEQAWNESLEDTSRSRPAPLYAVQEGDGGHLRSLGFSSSRYFNSGVMLLNLEEWRKKNYSAGLIELALRRSREFLWHDQDVLNIFFQNNWADLPTELNRMVGNHDGTGLVYHFNSQLKPWFTGYPDQSAEIYARYREKTPFVPFTPQFSLRVLISTRSPSWVNYFVKSVRQFLSG